MLLDGLTSSHPVSQEVQQATDIDRVFDWIAYKKGAALIRMLANFMGHSVFQMGLQDYLTIHKYGNAARNDLWNTLSKALKRVGKSVNIQEVMDQWTLQMGYPVITILGNETTDNVIVISQERFVYDSDAKPKDPALGDNSYLWQIPLTIAVGNTSHISSEAIIWVSNKSEHHRIPALEEASWLLGNINQTGYFRVNYDIRNWRLLINQLTRNHEVISVSNRAGLIDDAFNLARIPLNVRDIVYCTGVSLMDEDVWEFIWMKFHSTTAVSEKKILLEALTCSDDRNLLNRLLNLSLNSEVVLDQDAIDVIIHVARNPHGRDLAWKFFREKWKILNARYGEALFMNSKLISGVTEFLNTEEELRELKNFIKSYEEGAAASFSRAVETVEANVRWQKLYKEELFQWLRKSLTH
ncbi:thyrotropin-releasing hormone-degrading ectoenzyme [Grus japonensis]|uniref:Thyrotropin-releasing hormone-degrading ectoenzyme n=1 Tax=Grus japonensis TaxID=30415 RepID=A0ABC9VU75_GRUJA